MTTLLVAPVEFDSTEIEVTGAAHHHLFRVKRLAVGDEVRVVDGEGRARRAVVARVERAHAMLALGSAEPSRESTLAVELLVGPPKPDRAAWLVEKATEIGVRAIRFVTTGRSARGERGFGPAQILRLHRVARAAVEQCGRARVPEVSGPHPLAEMLERLATPPATPLLVLDPGGVPGADLAGGGATVAVAIGPEGGWSDAERDELERHGARRLSLGTRVLRVETAAVAAAALLLLPRADA